MTEENKGKEKEKRVGEGKRRRGGENDRSRCGDGGVFLGDEGSGNLNPVRRREGKVDWRSVNEENKGEGERRGGE